VLKPDHMDAASRNTRLCKTLRGMGLYVEPIFASDDPERIDYLHVSVTLPTSVEQGVSQDATSGPVSMPVTRPDVSESIESTEPGGCDVIDFPPEAG